MDSNLRKELDELHELIDLMTSSASTSNRYIYSKKIKDKVDGLIKRLVRDENDLVNIQLKKLK